jgi:hypothetical protein
VARRVILAVLVVANTLMLLMFVGAGTSFSLQRSALEPTFHEACRVAVATELDVFPYGDELELGRLRFDGEAAVAGAYVIRPTDRTGRTYPDRLAGRARCHLGSEDNELFVDRVEVRR